jgi:hypothetical protein
MSALRLTPDTVKLCAVEATPEQVVNAEIVPEVEMVGTTTDKACVAEHPLALV